MRDILPKIATFKEGNILWFDQIQMTADINCMVAFVVSCDFQGLKSGKDAKYLACGVFMFYGKCRLLGFKCDTTVP